VSWLEESGATSEMRCVTVATKTMKARDWAEDTPIPPRFASDRRPRNDESGDNPHESTHGRGESAVNRGSGQGPGVNRPPPTCPRTTPHHARSSPFEDQQPGTNIRISADLSSARMPTSIDENAEPVLSLLYLFILFSSLLSISGIPPRHHLQPDTRPSSPPRIDLDMSGVVVGGQLASKSQLVPLR